MSARPGPCGGHRATGVPTAITNYPVNGAPHPLQAAPLLPCHTRLVPQRSQMSNLFMDAPHFWPRSPIDKTLGKSIPRATVSTLRYYDVRPRMK
jgi:hypothetical protein